MLGPLLKKVIPSLAAERYDFKHDGLIHMLEGRRGRGKSYSMTCLTKWCAENRMPVITNTRSIDFYKLAILLAKEGSFKTVLEALVWFKQNIKFVKQWDDVLVAHDCVIILDEVSRLFDARARKKEDVVPGVVFEFFQQSRKVRVTSWLGTQSMEWVDRRIVQLVDLLWLARKEIDKNTGLPSHFWLYGLDPGGVGKSDNVARDFADYRMTIPFELRIARLYNSWELIQVIDGDPSFNSVKDILRYHVQHGTYLNLDQAELLEQHLDRFGFYDDELIYSVEETDMSHPEL